MRIIGIEPALPKPHYLSNLHLIRVGLPGILTYMRNLGHQVKLFMEEVRDIKEEELRKEAKKADLIAISTLSSTYPRGLELARIVKEETNSPVVMGGPHVSLARDRLEALFGGVDYILRFEGEATFPKLVKAIENKEEMSEIENLVYLENGFVRENPIFRQTINLDNYPFPDFSLIEGWRNSYTFPIETSRGCPYRCTFCCVHKMFPKMRFRSPESVVEEIKRVGPKSVFFVDDNFAIDMERSKKILSLMLQKLDKVPRWAAQVRASVAKDEEWLRLAKRTRCQFLCIGLESSSSDTLKEMRKNQTLEEIEKYLSLFRTNKMIRVVHGSFVVGFDTDDKQTAERTASWARKQDIRSVQIWVLTPLPGTKLRENLEKEERLLSLDPRDYDGTKATFRPANMSAFELQESVFKGMKKFYSLKSHLLAIFRGIAGITRDYILNISETKDLWRENFKETVINWYGRGIVKSIEKRTKEYLKKLKK